MKKKISIDHILVCIYLLITIWTNYSIYNLKLIPLNYRLVAIAFLSILFLLCLTLHFKKFNKLITYLRRGFIIVMSIALISVTTLYINRTSEATKKITQVHDTNTMEILVLTHKDSTLSEVADLEGVQVGYQDGIDIENAQFAMDSINEDVNDVQYVSGNNYIELAQNLLNNEIDALIISEPYLNSLEDTLPEFYQQTKEIYSVEKEIEAVQSEDTSNIDLTKDVFTVLLSASDNKASTTSNSLSDVNMILIVNPAINHVEIVSFPRDSFIPNLALGGANDKLTHTGAYGIENTKESIENVVGFDIDFYVKVNFSSVIEIVDTLGGVDVDVQYAFSEQNSERSYAPEDLITLQAGLQTLDGEQALAYSRHRSSAGVGDIGRTKAQQQIIEAIITKAVSIDGATRIPELLSILPNYITTNISESQINEFVSYELEKLLPWTTGSSTLENGYSDSLVTASMGNTLLSCYILNEYDVMNLYNLYYLFKNPATFNTFQFDISNLSIESDYQTNYNIVYAGSDYSSYQIGDDSLVSQESDTEDIPEEEPEEITYFTVTFMDVNGNVLSSSSIESGASASAPVAPTIEGYEFIGWDSDFSSVQADLTIRPIYQITTTDPTLPPEGGDGNGEDNSTGEGDHSTNTGATQP